MKIDGRPAAEAEQLRGQLSRIIEAVRYDVVWNDEDSQGLLEQALAKHDKEEGLAPLPGDPCQEVPNADGE